MNDPTSIVSRAKSSGMQAEVYCVEVRERSVQWQRKFNSTSSQETGCGVRLVGYNGRIGYGFSVQPEKAYEMALDTVRIGTENRGYALPTGGGKNKIEGIYDEKVFERFETIRDEIRKWKDLEKVHVTSVSSSVASIKVSVMNTEGIDKSEERTRLSFGIAGNLERDQGVTPEVYEYASSRGTNIEPGSLVERMVSKLERIRKLTKNDRVRTEVFLTPKAVEELLEPLISSGLNGERKVLGKTPFRQGQTINEGLKVVDDQVEPWAPYNRSFDGEGISSRRLVLIDQAVRSFMYDSFWAYKEGISSTASASRSYQTTPGVSHTNLVIDFTDKLDGTELDDVIVVDEVQGTHTSNFDTGEFSIVSPVAWLRKGGQELGLREVVLSGKLMDVLRSIKGEGPERMTYGRTSSGGLLVSGVKVL